MNTQSLTFILALFVTTFAYGGNTNDSNKDVALIYPDTESSEFLRSVLESMNIMYVQSQTDNGKKVEWLSNSDAQDREIQNRVSQYNFLREVCKSNDLPAPSEPAVRQISCK